MFSADPDTVNGDGCKRWSRGAIKLHLEIVGRSEEENQILDRTWKPRAKAPPAGWPPNQDLLVMVKEVPPPLTSASQKVILVTGRSVSITMMKLEMAETTGMFRVAPRLPVQLLFPDSRASQTPEAPGRHLASSLPWWADLG